MVKKSIEETFDELTLTYDGGVGQEHLDKKPFDWFRLGYEAGRKAEYDETLSVLDEVATKRRAGGPPKR